AGHRLRLRRGRGQRRRHLPGAHLRLPRPWHLHHALLHGPGGVPVHRRRHPGPAHQEPSHQGRKPLTRGDVRILAVDWGERRIGLAISDPTGVIATPLPTLKVRGREEAIAGVSRVAAEREVERIVVGLPLLMSGARGSAAETAEAFAAAIATRTGLAVETYDERLTSAMSQRRLHETGVRTGRAKEKVDQGAAVALLESFLQRRA